MGIRSSRSPIAANDSGLARIVPGAYFFPIDNNNPKSPAAGESLAHRRLKSLAAEWARSHRLLLCASEVPLPRSGYRADLAACTPRITTAAAFTAVFECKSSRADFLRDAAPESVLTAELSHLSARLTDLRSLIGSHRPDLRHGDELFPLFDCWDLRGLRHDTHDRLSRRFRIAQRKLHEGTKFSKMVRWRSASLLYAVTDPGVLHPWELPDGWGWLERAEEGLLVLRAKPCLHDTTPAERVALLERIAAAASKYAAPFPFTGIARETVPIPAEAPPIPA